MIAVLRLGHRVGRDTRISTHCGLVARAFGADKVIYSGEKDSSILKSVRGVAESWGGDFKAEYRKDWRNVLEEWGGGVVHLTMYGLPLQEIGEKMREKDLLVVVGGEKVPWEVYEKADWNVAVTSQPHSEIAALAVFLHDHFEGRELEKRFEGRKTIVPQERGKLLREER